jgi:hypothetical protein
MEDNNLHSGTSSLAKFFAAFWLITPLIILIIQLVIEG